ncbi:MAG: hypothetical protein R3B13_18120 [Polyangiaceae bacterium]
MNPSPYYVDPPPVTAPPVWLWYVLYAVGMALLYAALVVFGVWFTLEAPGGHAPGGEPPLIGALFAVISLPLSLAFGAAPFLPKRSWAWYYHLALMALGCTSACCLPACGALIYFWIKPETKAFFGVR